MAFCSFIFDSVVLLNCAIDLEIIRSGKGKKWWFLKNKPAKFESLLKAKTSRFDVLMLPFKKQSLNLNASGCGFLPIRTTSPSVGHIFLYSRQFNKQIMLYLYGFVQSLRGVTQIALILDYLYQVQFIQLQSWTWRTREDGSATKTLSNIDL